MKAMLLAAGLGTRLRPLTNDRPKALVTLAGQTLLEWAIARLRAAGVDDLIVNTHHHAGMMAEYLRDHGSFGISIQISREETLLDTGGGLKQAAWFFEQSPREPFLVHNVDVLSRIDLARMMRFHVDSGALATLAVQQRQTSRYLLFDESGALCGRRTETAGDAQGPAPAAFPRAMAFAGIHVLSPAIFAAMPETGPFSIIDCYLRLAATGHRIVAFDATGSYWRDLGTPASIEQAEQDLRNGIYPPD